VVTQRFVTRGAKKRKITKPPNTKKQILFVYSKDKKLILLIRRKVENIEKKVSKKELKRTVLVNLFEFCIIF